MDLPMKKRRMAEKIPMAPSGGCGGGSEATAFVSPPANRGRTIISSLQSSASSAATSYNNDENNNNDSIFSTRGGHQSHQSTEIQQKQRVLRPDEPNLYDIPSNLHATYQPLPFLVRMLISLSSAAMSWKQFITLTFTVHHRLVSATIKNVMVILVRYLLVSSVAKLCLQELMSPPSRVTTKYLADNDLLPSRLSRYQFVTPMDVNDVMGSDASEVDGVEKRAKAFPRQFEREFNWIDPKPDEEARMETCTQDFIYISKDTSLHPGDIYVATAQEKCVHK